MFGEISAGSQLAALRKRVDILIATPGRLLELADQRHINLSKIEILILDDADKILDKETVNEVKKVLKLTSQNRQTLFFSATIPTGIREFANTIMKNPVEVTINPVLSTVKTSRPTTHFTENRCFIL